MLCWALVELYRVQRASAGRRRQQIAYFLFGLAVYAAAGLFLAGMLPIVSDIRFDPGLVSYFSLAWMTFTFYAIRRHRLFDIRFIVSRTIVALVQTALLLALQVALYRSISMVVGALPAVVIASIVSGAALFTTPVLAILERRVEWLLVRRKYDYRRAMKESVRALTSIGTVDDVLGRLLGSIRDTIVNTSATLLLREGDVFARRQSYGTSAAPTELDASSALARWLTEQPTPFVREEQELGLPSDLFRSLDAELRRFSGEVAVPMRYRNEVLGILIVGPKADKDAFLQADLDLLETLANEAAIAVTNARLVEDLQQAVRARDDFVSVAGHELRTPLMALHLSVNAALRMVADGAPLRERLRAAERQILRLTRLTDDLLDVSRITAGRMTLEREPTDLGALVHEVVSRFSEEISRSGSHLELALSAGVIGHWDRLRIEQVVGNLLSNAVKYGDGQPITVAVEREANHARVIVRDRGIGIAPADQDRIFDRFERAAALHQRAGGFGLGLWITKQIVEAHGGMISLQSALGAGSTFLVALPLG
jgi:signal transduction histidine kinase